MEDRDTIEQFLRLSSAKLDVLKNYGFRRIREFEETSSTSATLVYRGKHLAFVFSFDVRDQCVDVEVAQVKSDKLLRNWEGGYSSNLFTHLVKRAGYRGSPDGSPNHTPQQHDNTRLSNAIDGWLGLLQSAGAKLLRDMADSLD